MSNPARSLRKRWFVSRSIQGRLARRYALCWLFYHVVLFHVMFIGWAVERQTVAIGVQGSVVPFTRLYASFASDHRALLSGAALALPIVLWDVIRQTHRIAGPLVRFRDTLATMANGEPGKPVQLRKGDLLPELEDAFNTFIGVWNARLAVEEASRQEPRRADTVSSEDWSDTAIEEPLEDGSLIRVSNSNVLVVSR